MALTSVSLMGVVIFLADDDRMLWPTQMTERYPIGFPLAANGAIWGNMILISAALYVIGTYSDQWGKKDLLLALILGGTITYALFEHVYLKGKFPDALAGGGRPISPAGRMAMLHMTFTIAAIVLFYFHITATKADVLIIGALLIIYIPVANHAVLGWLNSMFAYPWCPRIFAEESTPMYFIIGGEFLVVAATVLKLDIQWSHVLS